MAASCVWRHQAARVGCAALAGWALQDSSEERRCRCLERRLNDAYHLLEPERPLGVGGHGVVFPGVNRSSGEIMAIKQVSKKFSSSETTRKRKLEALRQRVVEEAEVLRIAGEHRSICSYKELFEGEDAFYLVTELALGGELFDRLVERGAYTANGAASVMREIVDAVAYLHQMGIAHLDLKPENILLASDETDASDVRLVDFGSARFLADAPVGAEDDGSTRMKRKKSAAMVAKAAEQNGGPAGTTPAYAAPEVLSGKEFDEKADVWSLGVILYLLLTGTHPFDANNDADDKVVTRRVLTGAKASGAFDGPNWARVPLAVRPLMRRLLADEPEDRPSAAEVSAHPWLVAPESAAAKAIALEEEEKGPGNKGVVADEASTKAAVDKLREFHRGRRRFKALLLAVMLGYADEALRLERGKGTACLGSRRAAMEVFDADGDGIVTHADVKRVARYLGEDLSSDEIDEMIRALDHHCRPRNEAGVSAARLRHLLPPLYPAHSLCRDDVVFSAGETDPRFYVLLHGDVLVSHSFTIRPRKHFVGKQSGQLSSSENRRRNTKNVDGCGVLVPAGASRRKTKSHHHGDKERSRPFGGRELSLGLHRLRTGQSFGETELLESVIPGTLPRASTAKCASSSCELLSVPGHLFQLLSDVFDGVQEPLRTQAEDRAKSLVWSWVSALAAHGSDGDLAERRTFFPNEVAWSNRAYSSDTPLGKSLEIVQKHGSAGQRSHQHNKRSNLASKPSKDDAFMVVEDGVVELTVADAYTGVKRTHTLWPKDFVYCNERPGIHPLDSREEFLSTVIVDVKALTQAQIAFVPSDVFQQALSQPAM